MRQNKPFKNEVLDIFTALCNYHLYLTLSHFCYAKVKHIISLPGQGYDKRPETKLMKQKKFLFSWYWRLESKINASVFGFFREIQEEDVFQVPV